MCLNSAEVSLVFKKNPCGQKSIPSALIISFTTSRCFIVSTSLFLLCNSLWPPPCRLKTYFLHVRYLLTALFCNCSRWEGKPSQSSPSVCYCYSTAHSFHECVTSPAHPSSLSLLCKFVPASQLVHCADKGLHPRVTTYRTGMLSEITGNKHLERIT